VWGGGGGFSVGSQTCSRWRTSCWRRKLQREEPLSKNQSEAGNESRGSLYDHFSSRGLKRDSDLDGTKPGGTTTSLERPIQDEKGGELSENGK